MKLIYKNGITGIIDRFFLPDSSSTTGAGKTGLTSSSAGLIISTIADNEASPTNYKQADSNIETITTLGTYAAPTASKCRFKEVDSTNLPGLYEIQLANARWAISGAKKLYTMIHGASGLAPTPSEHQLTGGFDFDDPIRAGLTAFFNLAAKTCSVVSDGGNSATQVKTDLTESANDYWARCYVLILTGSLAGQVDRVDGYIGATKILQFVNGFTGTPSPGDLLGMIHK